MTPIIVRFVCLLSTLSVLLMFGAGLRADEQAETEGRRPASDEDLAHWLRNMLSLHRYTVEEAAHANSMTPDEVAAACRRFGIDPAQAAPLDRLERREWGSAHRGRRDGDGRRPRAQIARASWSGELLARRLGFFSAG